ncbi:tail completion protein gp17 [Paraburkholderia adhaesiva]|uniref:tail completion protein gp17 n=1 Tax=Paraburkholderia adhaesiva TaxID=2883244 RepID=UPI001F218523|nr:DUF3168 domain-containing protein [Paraburkholderia adhaesiva]
MNEAEFFALLNPALPGRVFRILAPQDVREPYVIISVISAQPRMTLCGATPLWQMNYRVDSYARTHQDAKEIMKRILRIIDACNGDPMYEDWQEMHEQDTRIHRVSVVVSLSWQPDQPVQEQ